MVSFFEKLKKGMGIEMPEEKEEKIEEKAEEVKEIEKVKEKPAKKERVKQVKKIELKETKPAEVKAPGSVRVRPSKKEIPVEEPVEEEKPGPAPEPAKTPADKETLADDKEKWPEPEGQLAIDVYQTETELVIQSAIAGVKPEDLDISMERDILTIKGSRQKPFEESGDYFTQECYWGSFSREVILPVEVDPGRAEAIMKNGILIIRIPKLLREKKRQIKVRI